MIRKCYAKINLSLDILRKRPDGYHDIDTIMARVNLFDKMKIEKTDDNVFTYESNVDLGNIEDNLIYKAYHILKDRSPDKGIKVSLEKNIPVAAGLAGGSTDCAEMIKALNDLWELDLSKEEMAAIGKSLGADIPYFFYEGACRAQGIGEKLSTFKSKLKPSVLLINDGTKIASSYVYKRTKTFGHMDMASIVGGLEEGDPRVLDSFENVMEDVVLRDFPQLKDIKDKLYKFGADKALVSGSGASVFGLFLDENKRDGAYENLKDSYNFVRRVELLDD